MHYSAMINGKIFFEMYAPSFSTQDNVKIIEVGSQDVNGSLREVAPKNFEYVGIDFVAGKGVDIVLDDPYTLPLESNSVDIVVCSSVFEHSELFWVLFLEILRVLKPSGILYINVPSNGHIHRYPVDCWRFYPDSGRALVTWAKRNAFNPVLLESFISNQKEGVWNDFVAVFLKDEQYITQFKSRMLHIKKDFTNGVIDSQKDFINANSFSEDTRKLAVIGQILSGKTSVY